MIPQLTTVFGGIALNREKCEHRIDNGICTGRPFLPVLYSKAVVDHILNVSAVLRKHELLEMVIVCEHNFLIGKSKLQSFFEFAK